MSYYKQMFKYCIHSSSFYCQNSILNSELKKDFTIKESLISNFIDSNKYHDDYRHKVVKFVRSYNRKKSRKLYKSLLSIYDIAKTLNHFNLYTEIASNQAIKDNDFVLISEHNVILDVDFELKLNQLLEQINANECYDSTELVLLSYFNDNNPVDYINGIVQYFKIDNSNKLTVPLESCHQNQFNRYYTNNTNNLEHNSPYICNPQNLQLYNQYVADKQKILSQLNCDQDVKTAIDSCDMIMFINCQEQLIKEFKYSINNNPSINSTNNNIVQKLFPVNFIRPCYGAISLCYLMRKSSCKRIVKKYKLPFWYADDFKQFISPQNILMLSPFLVSVCKEQDINFINDSYGRINRFYRRNETTYHKYRFYCLKTFPFIQKLQYSENKIYRLTSKIIQKLLLLNN